MATQPHRQTPVGSEHALEPLFDDLYRRSQPHEGNGGVPPMKLRDWVELAEAWRITTALREHRGNRSAAARALGIGRRTLYSKMERLGIGPSWGVWASKDSVR